VKIKQSNNELIKLKKQKTIQEKLNFVFGKNGIQKSIMKSAVPELEYLSTKLMQKFCPYKDIAIKFELDPKTKDGELKSQGGLDILIVENGKEKNLSLYSGGETTQITFSIYLSLAELSSRRAGKRMQTLIIDERISGLDEDGINRFAEIIDVIRLRYKRCIVITHITQLKDLFDRQMLVSNTEDGSIIE
jgi:exonuclease SbcC